MTAMAMAEWAPGTGAAAPAALREAAGRARPAAVGRPATVTVATPEVDLHVAEWGRAAGRPPLLLLHGLANRWQAVAPLAAHLAADWHLVAPDLRGHGRSGRAGDAYTIGHFTGDVAAVLADRVGEPAVVYGHSLGGLVALALAASQPSMVRGVVVADSTVFPPEPDAGIDAVPGLLRRLAALGGPPPKQVDPEVMAAFRTGRILDCYEPGDVLPRVRCPVLLLQGDAGRGGHLGDLDARRALRLLPDGRRATVAGVGHELQLGDRHAVLAAIGPFLHRLHPPSATATASDLASSAAPPCRR